MILHVDKTELVKFTNKLEKLHRSAFPVAARETITRGAKQVKLETMPKHTKVFKKRQPNFFRANSKYDRAEGFDITKMKATVGFYENRLVKQAQNFAVKDLEQQEHGGKISHKAFIAMKTARRGRGLVKEEFRLDQLGNNVIRARGRYSKKQNFIRAAFVAVKKGGFILGNKDSKGSRTLSKIDEIWGSSRRQGLRSSRSLLIKRTPLYRVKRGRAVLVKRTDFMKRASMEAALQLDSYYMQEAQKQISKYVK